MKNLLFLAVLLIVGSVMGGKKNTINYYAASRVVYTVPLPDKIKPLSTYTLTWQLMTPHMRILKQGRMFAPKHAIALEFGSLAPGISLKLILRMEVKDFNGQVTKLEQPLVVYSKNIFARKLPHGGAMLPDEEFEELRTQGLVLEKLSDFDNSPKLVFCDAKDYAENSELLALLMAKGVTLVMFAPEDGTEFYLPKVKVREIRQAFSSNAKIGGDLSVISNKEKIIVGASSGNGALVEVEYQKGKIIIVSATTRSALNKTPDAALMLISSINPKTQQEKDQ